MAKAVAVHCASMRVLVTGASGFVGGRLVPELVAHGHEVIALVRDADRYEPPDRGAARVRVAEGDLLEPGSFDAALEGVHAAYYLPQSVWTGGDDLARDRRAAINFRDAADAAGVERVVYFRGMGDGRDERSEHLDARREVETVLHSGDASLTVLRAAIVIGAGSASFEMVRQLAARLPVMVAPRWVRTRVQPIAIDDVVAYLAGVLEAPETAGETYDVGGPDVLTYGDVLVRTRQNVKGSEPILIPVPVLSAGLSAYWVDLVTDVPAAVAHALVLGLRDEVVASDYRIDDLVDVDPTPFDEAVRRALADER